MRQARATLEALEAQRIARQAQIDLFAAPRGGTRRSRDRPRRRSALEAAVAALDPDMLSPREALEALYRLEGSAEETPP